MAALHRGKFQLRLATVEGGKNREDWKEERKREEVQKKKKEDEILCREKLEWIECERSNQVQLDSRKTRKGEGEETKERKSCERLSDKKKSQRSSTSVDSAAENMLSNVLGFECF